MYQSSEWSSCWLIASQTLLVAFFAIYLTFFYLGNIYSLSAHLKDIAWMNCSEAELPWAKQSQGWPSQVLGGTLVSSESSGDRIGSHQGRNNFSQVQLSSIWGRVVITLNDWLHCQDTEPALKDAGGWWTRLLHKKDVRTPHQTLDTKNIRQCN